MVIRKSVRKFSLWFLITCILILAKKIISSDNMTVILDVLILVMTMIPITMYITNTTIKGEVMEAVKIRRGPRKTNSRPDDDNEFMFGKPSGNKPRLITKSSLGTLSRKGISLKGKEWLSRNRELVFISIDLNNLDRINNEYGYTEGDQLLKGFANMLVKFTENKNGLIGRWHNDVFVIILNTMDINKLEVEVGELINEISKIEDIRYDVTPTAGVYFVLDDDTFENCINNSNIARKDAKREKQTFRVYDPKFNEDLNKEKVEVNRAIMMRELFINFQPVVNINRGSIIGLEALVRWNHPTKGIIPPNVFIKKAEQNGTIDLIGTFVLGEICHLQTLVKKEFGFYPKVNINVSAKELGEGFEKRFSEKIDDYGIPHNKISIEITESENIENSEVRESLRDMGKSGYNIYIDDFGTGYASFAYLRSLPIKGIKIDKSFLDNIDKEGNDLNLLRGIISLINTLKLDVVCEGVERESQLELLKELGIKKVQGFYFYKPMPEKEILLELNKVRDRLEIEDEEVKEVPMGNKKKIQDTKKSSSTKYQNILQV